MRTAFALLPLALIFSAFQQLAWAQPAELLVSGYNSDAVHRFDAVTGAHLGDAAVVPGAQSVNVAPDGHLVAPAEKQNRVLRLDGTTGALLGVLVEDDPLTAGVDETGGLDGPTSAVYGPDGRLYVASFNDDRVLRYDGSTGAFLDTFVAASSGGLNGPDAGMTFGPDGHLYVPSFYGNAVLRYDGRTGAFLDAFVSAGEGGLSRPRALVFRTDGWLLVASWGSNRVLLFDREGVFQEEFLTAFRVTGFVLDPTTGDWLTTNDQASPVRRYDGETGAFLGFVVPGDSGVIDGGTWLTWLPDQRLHLTGPWPPEVGVATGVSIANATPNGPLLLAVGGTPFSFQLGLCPGDWIGLVGSAVVVTGADATGRLSLTTTFGPALVGATVHLQAYDVLACRPSVPRAVELVLPLP